MLTFLQLLALLEEVMFFLGYFAPLNVFLEKLPKEEEIECLERVRDAGDEEARQKLINHNLRLVAHITKKYSTCPISQEDLLSIGTIGLIKGINTYDMDKGSKFASYVAKCIDNEILMAIRNENKLSSNVFLEDVIGSDEEGNSISLLDVVQSEEGDISDIVNLSMETVKLNNLINSTLSSRERLILTMRYGLEGHERYTQIQIASMLNISRSYVSRIEKKAIEKLAKEFQRLA
ncbi:MAG: RNA polymerase sporulation sigma factor SigK [Eubacteriaceae bacterium]|jgi:RNA polymerase sporulation-specific sigma factor|nr:RNA polymerase sporulation sigma factor SigK [Eubacteriaceae bacterium]